MDNKAYIYLDDLIGNLFITLKQSGYHVDTLSYDLIENYGSIIGSKLKENGVTPTFILSRDDTDKFLLENKDLYQEINHDAIKINKDISIDSLINRYHGYLPLEILLVVLDKETIKKTNIAFEEERSKKEELGKVKMLKKSK